MIEEVIELIPDIPRIYTAISEWLACMVCVLFLKRRFNGIITGLLAAGFLAVFCVFHFCAGLLPIYLWVLGMVFAVVIMFFTIFVMCDVKIASVFFWAARAFILAEFAASLEWQLNYFFIKTWDWANIKAVKYLFLAVIYLIVFALVFFAERRYIEPNKRLMITKRDIITSICVAAIIFLISNISFINTNTPFSGRFAAEIYYIRTLVNLCGLIWFYALQEQRLWYNAKLELDAMENIFFKQYEQYKNSKDNIELLNRRYHDLKHQIQVIKAEDDPAKKAEYLEDMEKGIKMYETHSETGNKVLDVLLVSKSQYCIENDINFTCVADGTLLKFISAMDICSIFGNALDNAIESVSKIKDSEKRLIKLAVYSQGELLMIRVENYNEKELVFEKGLPITSKKNKENHGYGLKSIKHIVEKYEGVIKIKTDDNWFSLALLIPLKKEG